MGIWFNFDLIWFNFDLTSDSYLGVRKYFYDKDIYFAAQQERLKQSMKEKQEENPDYKIDPKELAKLANVRDFDKLF